jgi:hypothetical protein
MYINIKDYKIALLLSFSNSNYHNNLIDKIYFSEDEKNLINNNAYNIIKEFHKIKIK